MTHNTVPHAMSRVWRSEMRRALSRGDLHRAHLCARRIRAWRRSRFIPNGARP